MTPLTLADLGSCVRCGHQFTDERDIVKDIGGKRYIADGKCHDRATVKLVEQLSEALRGDE